MKIVRWLNVILDVPMLPLIFLHIFGYVDVFSASFLAPVLKWWLPLVMANIFVNSFLYHVRKLKDS